MDEREKARKMAMFRETHVPHRLMKTVAGVLWETISLPWFDDPTGRVLINVRVPGDPTTLITVDALSMDPEGRECYCATAGEFYFRDTPEDAARRARDVEFLTRTRLKSSTEERA